MRIDLVFSYWIYLWFLLYSFRLVNYSPKFALLLGSIENAFLLVLMIYYGTNKKTIFYFVVINTIIKILPLYYLQNEIIKTKDIYATFILFAIFAVWLLLNGESLVGNAKLIYQLLLSGKNKTPFMEFMQKFEKNFVGLKM
jgi:hypothetical protein